MSDFVLYDGMISYDGELLAYEENIYSGQLVITVETAKWIYKYLAYPREGWASDGSTNSILAAQSNIMTATGFSRIGVQPNSPDADIQFISNDATSVYFNTPHDFTATYSAIISGAPLSGRGHISEHPTWTRVTDIVNITPTQIGDNYVYECTLTAHGMTGRPLVYFNAYSEGDKARWKGLSGYWSAKEV